MTTRDQPYCERHRDRADTYDGERRDREASAFYHSKRWRRIRKEIIQMAAGVCEVCKHAFADSVDHVIPRTARPDLELDPANLQAICCKCHSKKSVEERKRFGRAGG